MSLLDVQNLAVEFRQGGQTTKALKGVSFKLDAGKTLGLVGESGSGKSVSALSILRLLPSPPAQSTADHIRFDGHDLLAADQNFLRGLRGNEISMIFQEPMTALNPLHHVGKQIAEALVIHGEASPPTAKTQAIELMQRVGIDDAATRYTSYPHQLSGGQRQRIIIAMAIANRPKLLIADEPTTALDVTIQKQILDLLKDLQKEYGLALMLITHDLGVVRYMADEICVMRHGEIVESGPTEQIFNRPSHAYTRALFGAIPKESPPPPALAAPLLRAEAVCVRFVRQKNLFQADSYLQAVDHIDLAVQLGESLGIVGESGSGKTTLGRAILGLQKATGSILFDGQSLANLRGRDKRAMRQHIQIVFQDPFGALSPRMSVGQIISEGLDIHAPDLSLAAKEQRLVETMRAVELDPDLAGRYPHEFSGGQRQRIAIARALILQPRLLILDEPTSALDRSVQAQIIALLRRLQAEHGLAYLFISHDLHLVRAVSHRVLVLQHGKCVESGPTDQVFDAPQHPYTQKLISAILTS
jgi:microcin C transport system ATP-binding protein